MEKTSILLKKGFIVVLFCMSMQSLFAQQSQQGQPDRMAALEQRLRDLSAVVPGLSQEITLSVSGASIQEFLRALAETANLNLNVDPMLDARVYNNFTGETALNILLFLAREYNLDFNFIGSIISVRPHLASPVEAPPREIRATYDPGNDLLSLELNNDSLVAVARKITSLSGKNVIVTGELSGKTVSLFVSQLPFENALEQLAFVNSVKLSETAGDAYVFLPLGQNEENYINSQQQLDTRRVPPVQQTPQGPSSVFVEATETSDGGRRLNVEAFNTPLGDIIRTATSELGINYFLFSDIQGNVTARLQNVGFDDLLSSLLLGTDYTYKVENGIYMIGSRRLEGLRAIKVIQLEHRSIDTVQAMIPAEWRQGVEIKEFREQNTLLLAGSQPQIREIEALIKQLDKLVPMVLIEVTIVDVRKGHAVTTGITAGVSDSVQTGGTFLPGLDYTFGAKSINNFLSKLGTNNTFNIGRVTPNFYVKLSALEENSNVDIRSMPKLSTLNGHSASLSIGETRYYSISTQNVLGSFNPQTVVTEQFQEVEANLMIDIRPIVSGDEQVTLNISVDISDFIGNPPDNEPPPSATSKFESIIRVRNEEMIVLGGIERLETSESGSGTPLLSRIPVIKWLFSSRSKGKSKVVSVVFIKPTIIYQ